MMIRTSAAILAIGTCLVATATPATAQVRSFDIPAGSLRSALDRFARQSGLQVIYRGDEVRSARSPGARGAMPANAALQTLLTGSGFTVQTDRSGALAIRKMGNGATAQPTAWTPRPGTGETAPDPQVDTPAAGQDSADDPSSGNEIVVTAMHRRDRLQDVPASVGVVTGAQLRERNANSYREYLNTVPSVSYVSNGSYRDKIFIRGVAEGLTATTLATTGVYIDEASVSEISSSLGDISSFDIERVEVLRGPQGTLYGAGSMGGTVRVITAKPKIGRFEALGEGTLSYSADAGSPNYSASGAVNLPVADNFAVRIAAAYRREAGFINNIAPNFEDTDINDERHLNLRAQALFQPSDDFSILAGFQFQKDEINQGNVQEVGNKRNIIRRYPEFNKYNTKIYSLTINKGFGFANLVSATNYVDKKNLSGRDSTRGFGGPQYPDAIGSPLPADQGVGLLYRFPNKFFSQELRLSSTSEGPFTWLVGGYYSNFMPNNRQGFDTVATPALATLDFFSFASTIRRRNLAAFGELSFKPLEELELTAGYRHTSVRTRSTNISSGFLNDNSTTTQDQRASETAGTQKYRVTYKPNDRTLVYVQAAQGFRAGGPLGLFPSACNAELAQLGFSSPPTQYNSDSLWNYELGTKNTLFGNKLTVNATVYHIDWDNIQAARNLNCAIQFISNVGKAKSQGAELEITAHPTQGLDLTGSASYTNAKLKSTNTAIGAVNGDPIPNVPKWTLSGSARYEFPINDTAEAFVRGDVSYVSARWSDFKGLPFPRARLDPGYALVGLRAGVSQGNLEGSVFVTNLFDSNAVVNTMSNNALIYENVVRPRVIGATIKARY
jgi:outer membrane receptor protein involved in Fe transport